MRWAGAVRLCTCAAAVRCRHVRASCLPQSCTPWHTRYVLAELEQPRPPGRAPVHLAFPVQVAPADADVSVQHNPFRPPPGESHKTNAVRQVRLVGMYTCGCCGLHHPPACHRLATACCLPPHTRTPRAQLTRCLSARPPGRARGAVTCGTSGVPPASAARACSRCELSLQASATAGGRAWLVLAKSTPARVDGPSGSVGGHQAAWSGIGSLTVGALRAWRLAAILATMWFSTTCMCLRFGAFPFILELQGRVAAPLTTTLMRNNGVCMHSVSATAVSSPSCRSARRRRSGGAVQRLCTAALIWLLVANPSAI